ncbi:DUF6265 family protein [Flavobacterium silvaticum]|uniref:DUF6265 domain-containing protein n=1 Tax=Flavobacterium silvaticum TaxID=1852020 RepID=A0A972FLC1_9FLAO|nr:DUF6265 family protein [Flavobacterium silvaticum]NMH27828.1 hypothetical protein [Flavobacterium silvaticum]
MKNYFIYGMFATIVCLSFQNCQKKKEETAIPEAKPQTKLIDRAAWLIGRWENQMEKGPLIENWEKVNDSVFKGYSVAIENKDTVFSESMLLEQRKGDLFYVVSVEGQNDEKPVEFKLSLSRKDELRFENPMHDFPARIIYQNPIPDSLVAKISTMKGDKVQYFKFGKVH